MLCCDVLTSLVFSAVMYLQVQCVVLRCTYLFSVQCCDVLTGSVCSAVMY